MAEPFALLSCPSTPRASYTEFLPCPSTPRASYNELRTAVGYHVLLERGNRPCPSKTDHVALLDALSCNASGDAPPGSLPNDDCNHGRCGDIDNDHTYHAQENKDEKNKRRHEEKEDEVIFISSQPLLPNGSDSSTTLKKISDPMKERPLVKHRHDKGGTSFNPDLDHRQSQEILHLDRDIFSREFRPALGHLADTTVQKIVQGDRLASNLLKLDVPDSHQKHYTARRRVPQSGSSVMQKRRLVLKSDDEKCSRSKKRRTYPRQAQSASYKPIEVFYTDFCAVKGQTKTLKYEWNNRRKLWIAEGAPREIREWCGQELCILSENLTVRVRPNSDWLPVHMKFHGEDKNKKGMFEGSDDLEQYEWIFRVTPENMLEMLSEAATVRGVVIK